MLFYNVYYPDFCNPVLTFYWSPMRHADLSSLKLASVRGFIVHLKGVGFLRVRVNKMFYEDGLSV
jgi:hypothetical protein